MTLGKKGHERFPWLLMFLATPISFFWCWKQILVQIESVVPWECQHLHLVIGVTRLLCTCIWVLASSYAAQGYRKSVITRYCVWICGYCVRMQCQGTVDTHLWYMSSAHTMHCCLTEFHLQNTHSLEPHFLRSPGQLAKCHFPEADPAWGVCYCMRRHFSGIMRC